MTYSLMQSPRPSGCEIVPADDPRMARYGHDAVLREDRTTEVLHHYEQASNNIVTNVVFHTELAGEFTVPPARFELMYNPEVSGHSGTFRFGVE